MVKEAFLAAFEVGYRHYDLSMVYWTEAIFGEALRASRIPRSEVYIESKLGFTHVYDSSPESLGRFLHAQLARLGVASIDLYMIHHHDFQLNTTTWHEFSTSRSSPRRTRLGKAWIELKRFRDLGLLHRLAVSNDRDFDRWPAPLRRFLLEEVEIKGWQADFPVSIRTARRLDRFRANAKTRDFYFITTQLGNGVYDPGSRGSFRSCSYPELCFWIKNHLGRVDLGRETDIHYWQSHWARSRGVFTLRCSTNPKHIKGNFLIKRSNAQNHCLLRHLLRKPAQAVRTVATEP